MRRKPNVNDFTGSVSVEGDLTPITRQPVDTVNAKNWFNMTQAELLNQRDTLQIRYYKASSIGVNTDAIKEGLKLIDALLEQLDEVANTEDTGDNKGIIFL